jgi:hypothetical protein
MRMNPPGPRWAAAVAVALLCWVPGPAAADEEAVYRKLLKEKPAAAVTVKFILNVKMGGTMGGSMGGDQEVESEAACLLIDPNGLVLCSGTQLAGFAKLLQRMMGGMAAQLEISATPTDLEVLVGDDADGLEARLLARDTELDLAWVQIEDPGDRIFPFIDFSKGAKAEVGERFVAVRRMDRFFHRSPTLVEGRIGGIIERPRQLLVPAASLGAHLGLAVFNLQGEVMGFTVLQLPDEESTAGHAGNPLSMMERSTRLQVLLTGLILPAREVAAATQLALEVANEDEAEAAAD